LKDPILSKILALSLFENENSHHYPYSNSKVNNLCTKLFVSTGEMRQMVLFIGKQVEKLVF